MGGAQSSQLQCLPRGSETGGGDACPKMEEVYFPKQVGAERIQRKENALAGAFDPSAVRMPIFL